MFKYININIESDTCDLQTLNVRPLNLLQLPKIIITIYKQKKYLNSTKKRSLKRPKSSPSKQH